MDNKIKGYNILEELYNKNPDNLKVAEEFIGTSVALGFFDMAMQVIEKNFGELFLNNFANSECEVILHIGAPKTATTYIQNTLESNLLLLDQYNISYIPLKTLREFYRIRRKPSVTISKLFDLLSTYIKSDTKLLIFSEENLLYNTDRLISHIFGNAEYGLNEIKFYLTYIFKLSIKKTILTLRSYDTFYLSLFMERNRNTYLARSKINLKLMMDYSWLELVEKVVQIFGKINSDILFFEDLKKDDSIIFYKLTNSHSITIKLERSLSKRKSPNYKAYMDVEKLYRSDLPDLSKDFIRKLLMYPDLLRSALTEYGEVDADSLTLSRHSLLDLHTEKIKGNFLFNEVETDYLIDKYKRDKQTIIEMYSF